MKKESDYKILKNYLVDKAKENKLAKKDGYVYKPIDKCPCAYYVYKEYRSFINENLASHPLMKKSIKRFDEILKFMNVIDEPDFPCLKTNKNIFSFNNGILLLHERKFIPYEEYDESLKWIARNHIHQNFEYSFDTPLFHNLLRNQFEEDVCRIMYFMIGKLFFKIKEKDNYSIAPYLFGMGQTGKSVIMNVVSHMFHTSEIIIASQNLRRISCLLGKWEKEVMLVSECNKNFNLPLLKKMVNGDIIDIPTKNKSSIDVQWRVPIMMASNDYLNLDEFVMFHFHNYIEKADPNLENNILSQELGKIIWKSLNIYLDVIEENKGKDFWQFCPQYFHINK